MHTKKHFPLLALTAAALLVGALLGHSFNFQRAYAQPAGQTRNRGVMADPPIPLPRGQGEAAAEQLPAAQTKARPVQRWEYCALTGIGNEKKNYSSSYLTVGYIMYFKSEGSTGGRVEVDGYDNRLGAIAKASAELGEAGWELVGLGPGNSDTFGGLTESGGTLGSPFILYFKRPLY